MTVKVFFSSQLLGSSYSQCIVSENILINAKVHMHQVLSHGSVNDVTQIFQCPQTHAKTKYGQAARVKHALWCPHPSQFCEVLQGKHWTFLTESPAVDRAGLIIHHNKLSNAAVLVAILLASEVSYLLAEVPCLQPLHSRQSNVPTVAGQKLCNIPYYALPFYAYTKFKHRLLSAVEKRHRIWHAG